MRSASKILVMLLVAAMVIGVVVVEAGSLQIRPLTEQEKAELGANMEVQVLYTNLTTTTTNTAQTLTMNVQAKYGVKLAAMMLKKAFDTSNTNFTGSLAVKVGDGDDDDKYLTSTELASDGTEVWMKFGETTGSVYTAADTVDFIFTPNAAEAVGSNTVGEVRFYLRILDAAKR